MGEVGNEGRKKKIGFGGGKAWKRVSFLGKVRK